MGVKVGLGVLVKVGAACIDCSPTIWVKVGIAVRVAIRAAGVAGLGLSKPHARLKTIRLAI
jgi:hypothetical protein